MLHAMRPCAKVVLALLATITSHPWTDIVGDAVHDHRRRERARGSRRNDVGLAPNVKKKKIFFRLFSDLYFIFFMCFIFPGWSPSGCVSWIGSQLKRGSLSLNKWAKINRVPPLDHVVDAVDEAIAAASRST